MHGLSRMMSPAPKPSAGWSNWASRRKQSEGVEMGRQFADSNRHHRSSDLYHLDRLAAAVLLNARRLVEIGLKAKGQRLK
jgi:hypothetical protein